MYLLVSASIVSHVANAILQVAALQHFSDTMTGKFGIAVARSSSVLQHTTDYYMRCVNRTSIRCCHRIHTTTVDTDRSRELGRP
jgi:hypothetical protein